MAKAKSRHKDVEFAVDDASGNERIFKTFNEAAGFAVTIALTGRTSHVDVLIHSIRGARWWGGDEAMAAYREYPNASVSDRIEITANPVGRVY